MNYIVIAYFLLYLVTVGNCMPPQCTQSCMKRIDGGYVNDCDNNLGQCMAIISLTIGDKYRFLEL